MRSADTVVDGGQAINVDTLAWRVTRMMSGLFADTDQADAWWLMMSNPNFPRAHRLAV